MFITFSFLSMDYTGKDYHACLAYVFSVKVVKRKTGNRGIKSDLFLI
jgi:hypothetical protein